MRNKNNFHSSQLRRGCFHFSIPHASTSFPMTNVAATSLKDNTFFYLRTWRWFNFVFNKLQEMKLKLNALARRWDSSAIKATAGFQRREKQLNSLELVEENNWKQSIMLLRILFVLAWHCLSGIHANKAHQKILSIEANCTRDLMHVKINMGLPFKGMVFAKGFSEECGSVAGEFNFILDKKLD